MNGQAVTHLTAGVYEIQVRDRSRFHNFHLRGPGVDQTTDVEFVGTQTWTVTLTDGVYTFTCDPHASTMRGQFSVGSAQLPPPPPPPPPAQARCRVPKVVGKRLPVARRAIAVRGAASAASVVPIAEGPRARRLAEPASRASGGHEARA